jgi:hypothetical protein
LSSLVKSRAESYGSHGLALGAGFGLSLLVSTLVFLAVEKPFSLGGGDGKFSVTS